MLRYRISIQCFFFYVPVMFLPYSFHDPYFQVPFISFHDERELRIENLVACPFHGQFPFVPFLLLSLDSTFHPFPFNYVRFIFLSCSFHWRFFPSCSFRSPFTSLSLYLHLLSFPLLFILSLFIASARFMGGLQQCCFVFHIPFQERPSFRIDFVGSCSFTCIFCFQRSILL